MTQAWILVEDQYNTRLWYPNRNKAEERAVIEKFEKENNSGRQPKFAWTEHAITWEHHHFCPTCIRTWQCWLPCNDTMRYAVRGDRIPKREVQWVCPNCCEDQFCVHPAMPGCRFCETDYKEHFINASEEERSELHCCVKGCDAIRSDRLSPLCGVHMHLFWTPPIPIEGKRIDTFLRELSYFPGGAL